MPVGSKRLIELNEADRVGGPVRVEEAGLVEGACRVGVADRVKWDSQLDQSLQLDRDLNLISPI